MLLTQYQGMKFPVESIIRFFFKEALHLRRERVLELGCGNGNNLMLFHQYGWEVTGIDLNGSLIEQAHQNYSRRHALHDLANGYHFSCCNMLEFAEQYQGPAFDVVTLPHSVYYLRPQEIETLFRLLVERGVIGAGSLLFIAVRSLQDYRFGRGKAVADNCFVLDMEETGEMGCAVTFFSESAIVELLKKHFSFDNLLISHQEYGNYQNNRLIRNSDITLWGRVNRCG